MLVKSLCVAVAASTCLSTSAISNNNNNNNPYRNSNDLIDDTANNGLEQYSLNQHVSFDHDNNISLSAETEAVAYFGDNTPLSPHDALFCSGGSSFVAMAEYRPSYELYDEEEEEDSEDDDDDDGHGMMLSNASLRRNLYVSSGPSLSYSSVSENKDPVERTIQKRATPKASAFLSKTLSVRGGAAQGSEFAKRLFVAALTTIMYEGCIGHLLEFLKIVMQTSPPGTSYLSILKVITADKGIAGIYDGFIPWGVIQSVAKGGVFGLAHAMALSFLLPFADNGKIPKQLALTLAGGIGGGFQGYALSPTLLLKTRVMTNPVFREKMSLVKTTLLSLTIGFDVVLNEGFMALMKGANIFALKRVFDWSTRFYFCDVFEKALRAYLGYDLSAGQKAAMAFLAGIASTITTLPLDVIVAKTQDAKKAGVSVSPVQMFKNELAEKGWAGVKETYTSGFIARLLHVSFTTIAMKTGAPLLYDKLYK